MQKKSTGQKAAVNLVKKFVSKKKNRYVDDDFDLDLSYITDQIIAMGFPSVDLEGIYRNHMVDVQNFLETKHSKKYKVYNLCSEKKYDPSHFENRVEHFPFDDHNPPPFDLILQMCKSIEKWLNVEDENLVVIHCKAGKGRTGLVICSYLIYSKFSIDAKSALEHYGEKRTKNKKGVTLPSQKRYIEYFDYYLKNNMKEPVPNQKLKLLTIVLSPPPGFSELTYTISDSKKNELVSTKDVGIIEIEKGSQKLEIEVPVNVMSNDIKFTFYSGMPKNRKDKLFAYFWLNLNFIEDSYVSLSKQQIDKAHKNKKNFKKNFNLELNFSKNIKDIVQHFSTPSFNDLSDNDDAVVDIDDETDDDSSNEEEDSKRRILITSPTSVKSAELTSKKRKSSMFGDDFHDKLSTFGVTSGGSPAQLKDRRKSFGESIFAKPRSKSAVETINFSIDDNESPKLIEPLERKTTKFFQTRD
eukprot:gene5474-9292_t